MAGIHVTIIFLVIWMCFAILATGEVFFWHEAHEKFPPRMNKAISEVVEDVPSLLMFLTVIVMQ